MADKAELQHMPREKAALVLLGASSSLIARGIQDAKSIMAREPAPKLQAATQPVGMVNFPQGSDAEEQLRLGQSYNSRLDYAQAAVCFRRAADQGLAEAQAYLGGYCHFGRGVLKDDALAAVWLRKAADQGHTEAQFFLGACYDFGWGVPQDYAQAALWYRKAADQGHAYAQHSLGRLYYQGGWGLPQDYAEAYFWLNLALLEGTEVAKQEDFVNYRNKAASRLTPAELSRVQGRIEKWLAEHFTKQ